MSRLWMLVASLFWSFSVLGSTPTEQSVSPYNQFGTTCSCMPGLNCYTTGISFRNGSNGVAKDEAKGLCMLRRSCETGNFAKACGLLASIYEPEQHGGRFVRLHQQYAERACDLATDGGGYYCWTAALNYTPPGPLPTDWRKVRQYSEKGCWLGDGNSCGTLGEVFLRGNGVVKDLSRAKKLFTAACQRGDPVSCQHLRQTSFK
jgi:TPR repeat protein